MLIDCFSSATTIVQHPLGWYPLEYEQNDMRMSKCDSELWTFLSELSL